MTVPPQVFPAATPVRSSDAAWQDVSGEVVVLDVQRRVMRGLNPVGGQVWLLMDGRRTVAEIARSVAREAGEPEAVVLADLLAFVAQLLAAGLVHLETGSDGADTHG